MGQAKDLTRKNRQRGLILFDVDEIRGWNGTPAPNGSPKLTCDQEGNEQKKRGITLQRKKKVKPGRVVMALRSKREALGRSKGRGRNLSKKKQGVRTLPIRTNP